MSLSFDARVLVVLLAAYAAASTAMSLVVAATWRSALTAMSGAPRAVARRLLALRALPFATGGCTAALSCAAFVRHEPDLAREEVGAAALALAAYGVALLTVGLALALRTATTTAALVRRWKVAAAVRTGQSAVEVRLLQTRFPVVALAGILRPRLFVAACVVDECPPDELAVIEAHEMAHLRALDNLRRIVFSICPDVLAWMPASAALERAWQAATEQAADDAATGADEGRRLSLASALVRVARLATVDGTLPLPASALFRGEPIADRVGRLIAPPAPAATRRITARPLTVLTSLLIAAVLTASGALAVSRPHLHGVIEAVVRLGI